MDWRPFDARDRDPDVRKERVKLIATGLNAVGIAFLLGTLVAPYVDPTRSIPLLRAWFGVLFSATLLLLALWILRYMKPKE